MKTITLNEMKKVLDDTLSDLKSGKIKTENLIFFGDDGIGRRTIIKEWFEKHASEINYCALRPTTFYEEVNGILHKVVKDDNPQYCFGDDEMEDLSKGDSVLYLPTINIYTSEQTHPFNEIFKDRTYYNPVSDIDHDLRKLGLVIATAYDEDKYDGIHLIPELKDCSTLYKVVPSVEEFKDYFNEHVKGFDDERPEKIELFKEILSSPHFRFISEKGEHFSPVHFMMLFNMTEIVDKEEILSYVDHMGTCRDKIKAMFEKIFEEID